MIVNLKIEQLLHTFVANRPAGLALGGHNGRSTNSAVNSVRQEAPSSHQYPRPASAFSSSALCPGERDGTLSPNHPAVDRDHRSGHIVGQVGRKEFDYLSAIFDRPETP